MALNEGPSGPSGNYPERRYPKVRGVQPLALASGLALGAGLLAGGMLVRHLLKNRHPEGDGALGHRQQSRAGQPARMEL